jgi:hypothetical protein
VRTCWCRSTGREEIGQETLLDAAHLALHFSRLAV